MNTLVGPPLIALILVAVVIGVVLNWRAGVKRREALMNFARARGWSFQAANDGLAQQWTVPPFGQGDNRKARNVVAGTNGHWPFVGFDYSYETHSTDSKGNRQTTTHRSTVTALQLPAMLPDLCVTPENMLTRIGSHLGFADIELESEDFNRRFRVKADVPKFAYDVLNARTMAMLLAQPATAWRFAGSTMLTWHDNDRLTAAELVQQLDLGTRVLAGMPAFVWHDAGVEPPPATVREGTDS